MKLKKYWSPGKLLLSNEYAILKDVPGIAFPTKLGQSLLFNETENKRKIQYRAIDHNNKLWFSCDLDFNNGFTSTTDGSDQLDLVLKIFNFLYKENPFIFKKLESCGFYISTQLDFPNYYGLGSSSTFIQNICDVFKADSFNVLQQCFGGSGYDIAIAKEKRAGVFVRSIQYLSDIPTTLQKFFQEQHHNLFFVYLGKKQSSSRSINDLSDRINQMDKQKYEDLHVFLSSVSTMNQFNDWIVNHEKTLASDLGLTPLVDKFTDISKINGNIKSLGAWGGDFALLSSEYPLNEVKKYFENYQLNEVFRFQEMILDDCF